MSDHDDVMTKVRQALGRTGGTTPVVPPPPPELREPIVRLVHTEFGLPELWMKQAAAMKVDASSLYVEELVPHLIDFLRAKQIKRIMYPISPLLEQLDVPRQLREVGFDLKRWDEMTADEAYDFDCGLTDVTYAVAETGSLLIRPSAGHGRLLSLVPMVHVAIVEPKNFIPDLLDVFDRLNGELTPSGCVFITGPSKTADIEMNLVQGVHGPGHVKAFVLK